MSIQVEPYDHPTRFVVTSETDSQSAYIVDLMGLNGNGVCNCPDFQFNRANTYKATLQAGPRTRCKHILAARELFTDLNIKRHLDQKHEERRQRFQSNTHNTRTQ